MGHETPDDIVRLEQLERNLDLAKSPVSQILALVGLYLEPFHLHARAVELLEAILAREPANGFAQALLADCCIHSLMDRPSLLRAVTLTRSIIESKDAHLGAALMLLGEARKDLGDIGEDEYRTLMLDSIAAEPSWVFNHFDLAEHYSKIGRLDEARVEIAVARANVWSGPPAMSPDLEYYETMITGRAYDGATLDRIGSELLGN